MSGRTMPAMYADAFDGTYNRKLLLLVCYKQAQVILMAIF